MEIKFVFIGEPVPAARVKVTRNGTYTPARYREYKRALTAALRAHIGNKLIVHVGDVHLKATFYRKNKVRVDIDNLMKGLADSLVQAHLILDDSQIVSCELKKLIDSECPRVEFSLEHFQTTDGERVFDGEEVK